MNVRSTKMVLSALLLVSVATSVITYVLSTTQESKQIPSVIVVRYPESAQFGVYWDYECTQPVTAIDFGEIPQPRNYMHFYKTMYIRNEQPDNRIWVYWNSTLYDATTEITEWWIYNGTTIEPGNVYYADYSIEIQANVAVGTYQWTLGIWAEY